MIGQGIIYFFKFIRKKVNMRDENRSFVNLMDYITLPYVRHLAKNVATESNIPRF